MCVSFSVLKRYVLDGFGNFVTLLPFGAFDSAPKKLRSGERMQPTAQAVGLIGELCEPGRGERNASSHAD